MDSNAMAEGIKKKLPDRCENNCQKFFSEIERATQYLRYLKRELNNRDKKLQEREAQLESEREKLNERKKELEQRESQFEVERETYNKQKRLEDMIELNRKKIVLESKAKTKLLLEMEMDSLKQDIQERERRGICDGNFKILDNNKSGDALDYVTLALNEGNKHMQRDLRGATPRAGLDGSNPAPNSGRDPSCLASSGRHTEPERGEPLMLSGTGSGTNLAPEGSKDTQPPMPSRRSSFGFM